MIRNIYLRWRILCRIPLFLVRVGIAEHTQAAVKDFAHGVIGSAEPRLAVKRDPDLQHRGSLRSGQTAGKTRRYSAHNLGDLSAAKSPKLHLIVYYNMCICYQHFQHRKVLHSTFIKGLT